MRNPCKYYTQFVHGLFDGCMRTYLNDKSY